MKKFLCTLVIVLMASGYAFADAVSQDSAVSSFIIQRDMGNATGFRTNDGLQVLYLGTFRAQQPEVKPDAESEDAAVPDEGMFSVFMVKSERDTQLKLDVRDGIDIRTNKFTYRSGKWGYIADAQVNSMPRDIPAGFWVRVTFWHTLPFKFGERPLIARVGFVINGTEITFKRIRPRSWGDWTYIERNYASPLEEDSRRVEFEEMEVK